MLFHGNGSFANAPQYYVIRTLSSYVLTAEKGSLALSEKLLIDLEVSDVKKNLLGFSFEILWLVPSPSVC